MGDTQPPHAVYLQFRAYRVPSGTGPLKLRFDLYDRDIPDPELPILDPDTYEERALGQTIEIHHLETIEPEESFASVDQRVHAKFSDAVPVGLMSSSDSERKLICDHDISNPKGNRVTIGKLIASPHPQDSFDLVLAEILKRRDSTPERRVGYEAANQEHQRGRQPHHPPTTPKA